jgi:hypothetical protein
MQLFLYFLILSLYIIKMTIRNWRSKSKRATSCNLICAIKNKAVSSTLTIMSYISSDSWVAPANVTSVEYLVVGGGGGGGGAFDTGSAGGGGGGLVLYGTLSVVPGNTYSIVVGAGGTGGIGIGSSRPQVVPVIIGQENIVSTDGGLSSFDTIIALGGGGGRNSRTQVGGTGFGGLAANGLIAPTGGNGAGSASGGENGGGGGGNTTAGGSATTTPQQSRTGGIGFTSNITGSNVTYGAGGLGGVVNTSSAGSNAANNTGNGGGGATSDSFDGKTGGNGGSGKVILKYSI